MVKEIREIEIKPEVLLELIKASGYGIEYVSEKLKIPKENIEKGKLTLSQLKKLADLLKRPLVAFFSDEVPSQKVIPDYRLNREKRINPEVLLAERRLEYLIARLRELGSEKSKVPSFPTDLSPDDLAKKFRGFIGAPLLKNNKPGDILDEYKEILENKLNIIIIEYPLKPNKKENMSDDVRAFSIYDEISGIVLNESDHPSVKLFSLFHEVCHLLRKGSGICSMEYEVEEKDKEESYCNQFSAEFLVPSEDLKSEIEPYLPVQADSEYLDKLTTNLSKIYGVSKQAISLRLLYLGYITPQTYSEFKKYLEEKEKKPQFGRRNWEKVFRNRVGNLLLEKVKSSLMKNEITFYEALDILGIKVKYAKTFLDNYDEKSQFI